MNTTELIIKGVISELPKEQQDKVMEAVSKLQAVIDEYKDGEALIAFALLGSQLEDKK